MIPVDTIPSAQPNHDKWSPAITHDIKVIGLFGLLGLLGLIAIWRPVPPERPGGPIRLLGLIGLVGLAGFWNPWLGALGAVGAFGLWNHPSPGLRRLAWAGFGAPIGIALGVAILVAGGRP